MDSLLFYIQLSHDLFLLLPSLGLSLLSTWWWLWSSFDPVCWLYNAQRLKSMANFVWYYAVIFTHDRNSLAIFVFNQNDMNLMLHYYSYDEWIMMALDYIVSHTIWLTMDFMWYGTVLLLFDPILRWNKNKVFLPLFSIESFSILFNLNNKIIWIIRDSFSMFIERILVWII